MITQDDAVKAVDLMIQSLSEQHQKFPVNFYLLVSLEIAQHLANYSEFTGRPKRMFSGDDFYWKGFKCKVA